MPDRACVPVESSFVSTGVFVTGGTLKAPFFHLDSGPFSPLHVAPWVDSKQERVEGRLGNLQGDFFCCPFGSSDVPVEGVQHPLHGFCAHEDWIVLDESAGLFEFSKDSLTITKEVKVGKDHPAIYQKHTLAGEGRVCYGQHAMLQTAGRRVRWWTSPFQMGQVFPGVFEGPETGGRQSLQAGGKFARLDWVPGIGGRCFDISQRPHAAGCDDLCQIFHEPTTRTAWHAALFREEVNRLWISVKSRKTLPATVIWMSEGGRDYAPWNGRHKGVLALEDTLSHFHCGLADSIALNKPDRPTSVDLGLGPVVTRTGMTCLEVPFDFTQVLDIEVHESHLVVITDTDCTAVRFDGVSLLSDD